MFDKLSDKINSIILDLEDYVGVVIGTLGFVVVMMLYYILKY